jgi:hypothetical protein
MPTKKKKTPPRKKFGKRERNALLRIPYEIGPIRVQMLKDFAAKFGRSYHSANLKNKSLHEAEKKDAKPKVKAKSAGPTAPPVAIPMQKGDKINAYVLEELDSSWAVRSDTAEIIEKLEPVIDAMQPGQGTPFYSVNATSIRRWLTQEKEKTGKVFTIKTIRDNDQMKRIVRKS